MSNAYFHPSNVEKRRSERVTHSVPVVVRGVDLLGQAFEERTSALVLNLHGCKYSSKHHVPKNSWITLEPSAARRRRGFAPAWWAFSGRPRRENIFRLPQNSNSRPTFGVCRRRRNE